MDYKKIAQDIIKGIGGKDNINNLTHCFTRLRFELKDKDKANSHMLNRITGVVFDYMIVSSIMAIRIDLLNNIDLWITLLVTSTVIGFTTYFYLKYTIHKIYTDYPHQAFAALFGNLTGTASSGIALLREIDPNFETPASDDLVTGSSTAVMFGAPLLVITALITNPKWYYLWGSLVAMIIFFVIFSIFLYKKEKVK